MSVQNYDLVVHPKDLGQNFSFNVIFFSKNEITTGNQDLSNKLPGVTFVPQFIENFLFESEKLFLTLSKNHKILKQNDSF